MTHTNHPDVEEIGSRAEKELLRQQAYVDELFELTPEAIALLDENACIIRINREFQNLFGYTPEEAIGKYASSLIAPGELFENFEKYKARILGGERLDVETVRVHKDGTRICVSVFASRVRLADGEVRAFTIYRDITARKAAEEALRRKEADLRKVQSELAHVNRVTTMGELAASIAHEVNQPLTGMVTNGDACLMWLSKVKGSCVNLTEAKLALEHIVRDGHRAGEIVTRIRGLFKKVEPSMDPLNLNATVREMLVLTKNEADKKSVHLELELAADLPRTLGDKVLIQQVLLNLILNAIEALSTIEGRPRHLVVKTASCENSKLLVQICDNGVGIQGDIEQVFEAFRTTKPGGLGMGLSVSRSIIENHGGKLWGETNAGPGMTFQFVLPVWEI